MHGQAGWNAKEIRGGQRSYVVSVCPEPSADPWWPNTWALINLLSVRATGEKPEFFTRWEIRTETLNARML